MHLNVLSKPRSGPVKEKPKFDPTNKPLLPDKPAHLQINKPPENGEKKIINLPGHCKKPGVPEISSHSNFSIPEIPSMQMIVSNPKGPAPQLLSNAAKGHCGTVKCPTENTTFPSVPIAAPLHSPIASSTKLLHVVVNQQCTNEPSESANTEGWSSLRSLGDHSNATSVDITDLTCSNKSCDNSQNMNGTNEQENFAFANLKSKCTSAREKTNNTFTNLPLISRAEKKTPDHISSPDLKSSHTGINCNKKDKKVIENDPNNCKLPKSDEIAVEILKDIKESKLDEFASHSTITVDNVGSPSTDDSINNSISSSISSSCTQLTPKKVTDDRIEINDCTFLSQKDKKVCEVTSDDSKAFPMSFPSILNQPLPAPPQLDPRPIPKPSISVVHNQTFNGILYSKLKSHITEDDGEEDPQNEVILRKKTHNKSCEESSDEEIDIEFLRVLDNEEFGNDGDYIAINGVSKEIKTSENDCTNKNAKPGDVFEFVDSDNELHANEAGFASSSNMDSFENSLTDKTPLESISLHNEREDILTRNFKNLSLTRSKSFHENTASILNGSRNFSRSKSVDSLSSTSKQSTTSKKELRIHSLSNIISKAHDKKLFMIAKEVASSEHVFVDVLKLINVDFRLHIKSASSNVGHDVIPTSMLDKMFKYLPHLQNFNEELLKDLNDRIANWDEKSGIADIFVKKGPFLKLYSSYIRDFSMMTGHFDASLKKYTEFQQACKEFEMSPRCASLTLKHYMLKPVQRIPQYKLLLQDYMKHLPIDSPEMGDMQTAYAIVSEVANHANENMKREEYMQKLIEIQKSLGDFEVIRPDRIFLKEGELMKLSRKEMQPRYFFLFNDVLLYTTPVATGYKLINVLPLLGMQVLVQTHVDYKLEFTIITTQRSFIIHGKSIKERDDWVCALKKAIEDITKNKIAHEIVKNGLQDILDKDFDLGQKAPPWIPDDRVTMCMLCTCAFTVTRRRHHCRACGWVVCGNCSNNSLLLGYKNDKLQRVCDCCYSKLFKDKPDDSGIGTQNDTKKIQFLRRNCLKEVPAYAPDALISGYLQKWIHGKKWKKYWFLIKNNVLYTFKATKDTAAMDSMVLLGYEVQKFTECYEGVEPELLFQLVHKNTPPIVLRSDDADTTMKWLDFIQQSTVCSEL